MAVTFKVPKSPSRDIAATDTFMGVDLTNTGANIDGIRSPHAPNMVRLVPGKVRKRMGYYKEVLFGTKTNVNFAKGTSATEKEIVINSSDTSTWVKIYDTIQTLSAGTSTPLYLEFDYKSEDTFNIINSSVEVTASEEWEHISTVVYFTEDTDITEIKVFSENAQEIYIKNFSVMLETNDSYAWSPAPEYFVERETNDPVYGVHFLRNGKDGFEGDRITNTNRVLGTSDEWQEWEYSGSDDIEIYKTKDIPGYGTQAYIDFDYQSTSSFVIKIENLWNGSDSLSPVYISLQSTNGETAHYSLTVDLTRSIYAANYVTNRVLLKINSSASYVRLKNFSVCYAKDENFAWSPAPEDNGGEFHQEDMFVVGAKNYATETELVDVTSSAFSTSYTKDFYICTETQNAGFGKTKLSFDITATTDEDKLEYLYVWGVNIRNGTSTVVRAEYGVKLFEEPEKLHVELYEEGLDETQKAYIGAIRVTYYVTGSTKATTKISNVKVEKYENRDNYYVSPKSYLYHVGKDFYIKKQGVGYFEKAYDKANEHISKSFQINNLCYIIDGKETLNKIANAEVFATTNVIHTRWDVPGYGFIYRLYHLLEGDELTCLESCTETGR